MTCTLSVVSLDQRPEYESLSYAWGAPIFEKEIVIKDLFDNPVREPQARISDSDIATGSSPAPDSILAVTMNLYTAFRYLRKSDQTRVVCIVLRRCILLGTGLESEDDVP